jgi:purine-cytosine permease-like protein
MSDGDAIEKLFPHRLLKFKKEGKGMNYSIRSKQTKGERHWRGILVVALLMMLFGLAEMVTGFTHTFFGVSTTQSTISTYAGVTIGALYVISGLLILTRKKRAAGLAIVLLGADIVGRITMAVTGLYPTDTLKQTFAIIAGTAIVAIFAIYIGSKWKFFN